MCHDGTATTKSKLNVYFVCKNVMYHKTWKLLSRQMKTKTVFFRMANEQAKPIFCEGKGGEIVDVVVEWRRKEEKIKSRDINSCIFQRLLLFASTAKFLSSLDTQGWGGNFLDFHVNICWLFKKFLYGKLNIDIQEEDDYKTEDTASLHCCIRTYSCWHHIWIDSSMTHEVGKKSTVLPILAFSQWNLDKLVPQMLIVNSLIFTSN